MTSEEKIRLIAQKLALLSANIDKQKAEIDLIKGQVNNLLIGINDNKVIEEITKITETIKPIEQQLEQQKVIVPEVKPIVESVNPIESNIPTDKVVEQIKMEPLTQKSNFEAPPTYTKQEPKVFNYEQYLGGKLAGVIGIIALVIGLAMGVKYAIDKDLINPLTRVLFGFISGGILMTFAFILKKKYQLFSAIVLGGSVSILFFSAFAGHAFYGLYPRGFAFSLMFIITSFTVFAAHSYNYEVIAVIGLVGAYAIPPLLSDGSGKIEYMFTYMAIINTGILILSLFKNWTWVKYFAYGLTWILTASWVLARYTPVNLNLAMVFLTIFFLTFYISFIAYKVIRKIPFQLMDITTLLSNSFIYFGLGYFVLNNQFTEMYLGLFCLFNALIHIAVAYITYTKKVTDKNILYFILALVFTFITIAIPIQLEGTMVTICWFAEMMALYFIGHRFGVLFFKQIAYAVSALGFVSLWHDWMFQYVDIWSYDHKAKMLGTFNKVFVTSAFSSIALGVFVYSIHKLKPAENTPNKPDGVLPVIKIAAPIMFFSTLYFTFFFEIINYFQNWETATAINHGASELYYTTKDPSIMMFMWLWLLIYTSVYASVCFFVSGLISKSRVIYWTFYSLSIFSLVLLIPMGLATLGELRTYFNSTSEDFFPSVFRSTWMINFRYVFITFSSAIVLLIYVTQRGEQNKMGRNVYVWFMHITILALLSSELVNQFRLMHPDDAILYDKIARRMGLTILWALYSMMLIVLGIARKLKMLRIMGLALFGAALIKLLINSFNMSGGYKIIVWISIGVILTLIGFLYQRYKTILFGDDDDQK